MSAATGASGVVMPMPAEYAGRKGRPWRRAAERVRRTQDVCHLCGKMIDKTLPPRHPQSFSVDHILPLSLNPQLANDPTNLAAAHLSCNLSLIHI